MKKIFLLVFCTFAFSTQSFAQNVTVENLTKKAVLSYYDNAEWTNSGVNYFAMNTSEWKDTYDGWTGEPFLASKNSAGKLVSCPDNEFSIIKIDPENELNRTLFACVSVENFLNYVVEGTYPVNNRYRANDASKLIEKAVLEYYNQAHWTNSSVKYIAFSGDTDCPDAQFSINKIEGTAYTLFTCVSVKDFLNYVAEGIYPAILYKAEPSRDVHH